MTDAHPTEERPAAVNTMSELSRMKAELDNAHIPEDVLIGSNSTVDRLIWLIRRNALNERAARSRFETFSVEFGLLTTLDSEWRTADELHTRIGYGEREDVKDALEYLHRRGLIDACNNGYRGNLYAAKDTSAEAA